jgi:hypothetical protein
MAGSMTVTVTVTYDQSGLGPVSVTTTEAANSGNPLFAPQAARQALTQASDRAVAMLAASTGDMSKLSV